MDAIDAEHLQETLKTQGWAHYFQRLTEEIRGANLRRADLRETNLSGADLSPQMV